MWLLTLLLSHAHIQTQANKLHKRLPNIIIIIRTVILSNFFGIQGNNTVRHTKKIERSVCFFTRLVGWCLCVFILVLFISIPFDNTFNSYFLFPFLASIVVVASQSKHSTMKLWAWTIIKWEQPLFYIHTWAIFDRSFHVNLFHSLFFVHQLKKKWLPNQFPLDIKQFIFFYFYCFLMSYKI